MPRRELSVAVPSSLNLQLLRHLIRADSQEDLAFALWAPSQGSNRYSALINELVLPELGDRQIHRNVSFNPQYFERTIRLAAAKDMGLAFLHSHPSPGWQGMSKDDIAAERRVPFSIAEEPGYRAALDCDVLFSCVDRPRARSILNHLAYAHLIPVIDGGIQVRFKNGEFSGADWQLQTVAPTRPCLDCLGVFYPADVETEKAGLLDDPSYLRGLDNDHRFKRNENVFPFSANLASLEIFQLIALATGAAGIEDFGVQRFRYVPGHFESDPTLKCRPDCLCGYLTARGDTDFTLFGNDVTAEDARRRQGRTATAAPSGFLSRIRSWFLNRH